MPKKFCTNLEGICTNSVTMLRPHNALNANGGGAHSYRIDTDFMLIFLANSGKSC